MVTRPTSMKSIFAEVQSMRDRERRPRLVGATSEELRGAEIILGFKLPQKLREWFLLCDGGWLHPPNTLVGLLGNHEALDLVSMIRGGWPRNKLPVATDGSGSYFCLLLDYPDRRFLPVGYISGLNRDEVEFVVASSLESFLSMFVRSTARRDKKWPSKTMKWYQEQDPDLMLIEDLPLPWTVEESGR